MTEQLREAAQRVLGLIDTAVREDDDTATLYDELSPAAIEAVEALRAALDTAPPAVDVRLAALAPFVLRYAIHSGACCTFDGDGKVIVTRESCTCDPRRRAVQEVFDMFGRPDEYRARLGDTR
jgi:hypothetical protein